MTIRVLDPTVKDVIAEDIIMPGLTTLKGKTVSLLDNGKFNVKKILDHMEEMLRSRHDVKSVRRFNKSDASRPITPELLSEMEPCDAVISAVGD